MWGTSTKHILELKADVREGFAAVKGEVGLVSQRVEQMNNDLFTHLNDKEKHRCAEHSKAISQIEATMEETSQTFKELLEALKSEQGEHSKQTVDNQIKIAEQRASSKQNKYMVGLVITVVSLIVAVVGLLIRVFAQ